MNIEKNIPLPERKRRESKWDFLGNLEVGDSFVVATNNAMSMKAMISRAKGVICPGIKLAYKDEGKSLRVWRKA